MHSLPTGEVATDSEGNRFHLRPIDCPVCEIKATKVIGYRGGPHHRYGLGVVTRIVRCGQCNLMFPDPFPFPLDAQRLYGDPEKYFEHNVANRHLQHSRETIRELISRSRSVAPSLLDVGSGRGDLLQAARLEGITDVFGLDFSEAMIAHAAEQYGVTVHQESIEEHADRAGRTYDVVTLVAVMEHVYNPNSMIASAARLTHPGSVLLVVVPMEPHLMSQVGGLFNRLKRSQTVLHLAPTFSPYHVFGFDRAALATLLSKHGFDIERRQVWANPHIPACSKLTDRVQAFAGTQLNRVANLTRTASIQTVWARRRAD